MDAKLMERLDEAIARHGLEAYREMIVALARPTFLMELRPAPDESALAVGCSKLGCRSSERCRCLALARV